MSDTRDPNDPNVKSARPSFAAGGFPAYSGGAGGYAQGPAMTPGMGYGGPAQAPQPSPAPGGGPGAAAARPAAGPNAGAPYGGGAGAAPAAGPLSFDVTEADFRRSVLERSLQVPVLLDCWAPWCAPCRNLKPVLEKLVAEYGGQFVLAKLNTDEAPQISAALQLRSIPMVVLFIGGRPVDQFSGALPEAQVRAFLDRHLGPAVDPVEEFRAALAEAPPEEAEALLRQVLQQDPSQHGLALDLAERLMARGALDEAQPLLDRVPAEARDDRHAALVKRAALAANRPPGEAAAFEARIAADPKDHEARLGLGALQMWEGRYDAAFDTVLEVVLRDKGEWRDRARRQLIEWFEACGDAAAVSRGRRYLGMYLN